MADNPFDPKYLGLLGALRGEPPRNALADYVSSLAPKPEVSPMAQAIANLLMDKPTPALPVNPFSGAAHDLFSPPKPAPSPYSFGNLGAVADLFPPANPYPYSSAIADLLGPPKPAPTNALSAAVSDLFPTAAPSYPFGC